MIFALVTAAALAGRPIHDGAPIFDPSLPASTSTEARVTIDVSDADLRQVLTDIAAVSGRNLVLPEDLDGRVTARLDDLPWDEALTVVLEPFGLTSVTTERFIVIRAAP